VSLADDLRSLEAADRDRWCELFEAARLELGMSNAAAATMFGVGMSTIRRWRRGESAPPRGYRRPIALRLAQRLEGAQP